MTDRKKKIKFILAIGAVGILFGLSRLEAKRPIASYAKFLCEMGLRHQEKNHDNNAIKYFRKAIYHNPRYAPAYYYLGKILGEKKGGSAREIELYEKAAALDVNKPRVYLMLSAYYVEQKQLPLALEVIEKGIRLAGTDPDLRYRLGLVYEKLGRFQEAIETYKFTLMLRKDDRVARSRMAHLYYVTGQTWEAKKNFAVLLGRHPSDISDSMLDRLANGKQTR